MACSSRTLLSVIDVTIPVGAYLSIIYYATRYQRPISCLPFIRSNSFPYRRPKSCYRGSDAIVSGPCLRRLYNGRRISSSRNFESRGSGVSYRS